MSIYSSRPVFKLMRFLAPVLFHFMQVVQSNVLYIQSGSAECPAHESDTMAMQVTTTKVVSNQVNCALRVNLI